jgi:4-hydroxy-tetrahydrodipicolinate synthase
MCSEFKKQEKNMAMPLTFTGVYPILVTPFDAHEQLDLESFDRLIRFMADIGVDGITVLGVLGESDRILDNEREQLIRVAVKAAAGRIPVVVGASHKGTHATRGLCLMAAELGASAVMVTPAQEPVPNEERIFEYFRRVADGLPIPLVVQDHPASTQVHMSIRLLLRLVTELPEVACFKEEGVPTPVRVEALLQGMTSRKVPILTGLGALYGLFDLRSGSSGFMTGFAFPEVLMAMVQASRAQDQAKAAAIYRRFLPLIVFEQQPGIAIRKELFRRRGLLADGTVRHPGVPLNPASATQLEELLQELLPGIDLRKRLNPTDVIA